MRTLVLAAFVGSALSTSAVAQRVPDYLVPGAITPFNALDGLDGTARPAMILGLAPTYGGALVGVVAYVIDGVPSEVVLGAPIGGLVVGPSLGYVAAGSPGRGLVGVILRGSVTAGAILAVTAVSDAGGLDGIDDLALVGAIGAVAGLVVFGSWAHDTYDLRERLRSDTRRRAATVSFVPVRNGVRAVVSVPL